MARSSQAKATSNENDFHVLDPLGEIKNRAKELLSEQGKDSGTKNWKDFVEEAENDLLRANIALHHQISCIKHSIQPVPPKLAEARSNTANPILRAVSLSTATLLNWHEAFCLTRMLNQSVLCCKDTGEDALPSRSEIALILSELVEEYPSHVTQEQTKHLSVHTPLPEKLAFWEKQIKRWLDEDSPLNFSDRNTIQRFHLRMIESGIISNIKQRFSSQEG